jgi:hypothetical protein
MPSWNTGTLIDLAAREAVALDDVRGATLRVVRGTVWVTQERDPDDVILRAGDNWAVERDGRTVLEAQDNTQVWVVGRHVEPANDKHRLVDWAARLGEAFLDLQRRAVPYV